MRANVYVDGFNLYYGLRYYEDQGRSYKWLDLAALCRAEIPSDSVNHIRYFTARVRPRPANADQGARQDLYLRALETIPGLTIDYGRFLETYPRMPRRFPSPGESRTVEVIKTEEKGSDVNIATRLLCDAYARDFELAVIISNDSDLRMPIDVVRRELKLKVGVLNPNQLYSNALAGVATFYRKIKEASLAGSQFPSTIRVPGRNDITKPATW